MNSHIQNFTRENLVERLRGEELDRFNAICLHINGLSTLGQLNILLSPFTIIAGGCSCFIAGVTKTYDDIDIFLRHDIGEATLRIPEDLTYRENGNAADGTLLNVINKHISVGGVRKKVQLCLTKDLTSKNTIDYAIKTILRFDLPVCRIAVFLHNGIPCKIVYNTGPIVDVKFHRYYQRDTEHLMRRVKKYEGRKPCVSPPSLQILAYKKCFFDQKIK